jgi:hypothetical protein
VVEIQMKEVHGSDVVVKVEGSSKGAALKNLSCYVNGQPCDTTLNSGKWTVKASYPVSDRDDKWEKWASPALKQTIVVITAYTDEGSAAGKLVIL